MSTEVKEKSLAVEAREASLRGFITNHAVNAEAVKDCLNSLSLESFETNGIERVIVRNADGQILLKDEDILDHLKKTRPSYLYSEQQKQQMNAVANDINATYQKEKDDLQAQVNAAASSGDFKLFKKLRKQQGATYQQQFPEDTQTT